VSLLAAARLPRLPAGSRLDAVGIALWGLRIGVVMVVVIGTIGSLIKARYTGAQWFDLVMFGLTIGSIYAQIALGYTMVYGVLRMINFAHGEIVMSGAFAGYFVATAFDRWASSCRARCRRWRRSSRSRS
jgi:branched-chain amino acid transport system permease protein